MDEKLSTHIEHAFRVYRINLSGHMPTQKIDDLRLEDVEMVRRLRILENENAQLWDAIKEIETAADILDEVSRRSRKSVVVLPRPDQPLEPEA